MTDSKRARRKRRALKFRTTARTKSRKRETRKYNEKKHDGETRERLSAGVYVVRVGRPSRGSSDGRYRDGERISTRLDQVLSDDYNDNPAEAVKKLDELFQNPTTLAYLRKSEKANELTLWFVALCRTNFRLKATLKLYDGAEGAELDPQAWTKIYLMFLDRAESAFERGDVESALATIEDLCAMSDVAKLALGDTKNKILERMVEIWAKAKLRSAERTQQAMARRNERAQFPQQTQNAANVDGNSGGYTQEQSRIMQQEAERARMQLMIQENNRMMSDIMRDMRMDRLRSKQYELEAKRREDAIRREQHRIDMDKARRTAESFRGMFGD